MIELPDLSKMTNEEIKCFIESPAWVKIGEPRADLIRRNISGDLNKEEEIEYNRLQEFTKMAVNRIYPFDKDDVEKEIRWLRKGMTRQQVKEILGEPDNVGGISRKQKIPLVYLYGQFEIAFGSKIEDSIFYIMDRGKSGLEHNFIKPII